jgi:hypothetical protein
MDRGARRKRPFCFLSVALIFCTGCLRVAPKIPKVIGSPAISYSTQDFDADVQHYRTDVIGGQFGAARSIRDQIAYRVLAQIDAAYGGFELSLSTRRAGAQTAADATQLGLTAAATVTGTTEIKDILTVTATAFQGTRLSFDKNFFEEKTTEALISQMRASRTTLKAQILRSLSRRDVNSYPLEAAWMDIVSYYYAGTIPSALVDIAAKAGNDAALGSQELKEAVHELTLATPEQAKQSVSIRSEYQQLSAAISSGDPATVQQAGATLHKILDAADITYDHTAQPAELLAALKEAMKAAADNGAVLTKLNAAVQAAASKKE